MDKHIIQMIVLCILMMKCCVTKIMGSIMDVNMSIIQCIQYYQWIAMGQQYAHCKNGK